MASGFTGMESLDSVVLIGLVLSAFVSVGLVTPEKLLSVRSEKQKIIPIRNNIRGGSNFFIVIHTFKALGVNIAISQ